MSEQFTDQFTFPSDLIPESDFVMAWDYRGHVVRRSAEYILWRLRGTQGWLTVDNVAFGGDWGDAMVFKGHELEKLNMMQRAAVRLDDAEAIKLCGGTGPE